MENAPHATIDMVKQGIFPAQAITPGTLRKEKYIVKTTKWKQLVPHQRNLMSHQGTARQGRAINVSEFYMMLYGYKPVLTNVKFVKVVSKPPEEKAARAKKTIGAPKKRNNSSRPSIVRFVLHSQSQCADRAFTSCLQTIYHITARHVVRRSWFPFEYELGDAVQCSTSGTPICNATKSILSMVWP